MLVVVDPMVVLLDWLLSPDAVFEAEVDLESSVPPHALTVMTRKTTMIRAGIDPNRVWRFEEAAISLPLALPTVILFTSATVCSSRAPM